MAMEFARLYFDFFTSEKTQFLLDECGSEGVVCLLRLWVRAGQRNNDGTFNKTGRALEKIAGWKGEDGKLIKTLTDPDFIFLEKVSEDEFCLHNWLKNNDHLSDKAKEMRIERARKAGLASAEKRKEEPTKSQPIVNSKSTHSQLDPTRGQLDPTNLTELNLTELNTKDIVEKPPKKRDIIDAVIKMWNSISNQNIHLTTESFRKQIRGRIVELRKQDKDDESILNAFEYVFNNKKLQAEDDVYERFTVHDWNITTLTRPKNFMKYLVEPEYKEPELGYDPKDFEGDCNG